MERRFGFDRVLMALVFCLPIFPNVIGGFLALLLLFIVIEGRWRQWSLQSRPSLYLLALALPVALWVAHLLGILWSDDIRSAWDDVGKKITLLLVPLILGGIPLSQELRRHVFNAFLAGLYFSIGYHLVQSFFDFLNDGNWTHFTGEQLSEGMHLGYYAMYLLFGIGLILQHIFRGYSLIPRLGPQLSHLGLLILVLILMLTGSKMGFITLAVLLSIALLFNMLSPGRWMKGLLFIGFSILALTVLWMSTDFLSIRFESMLMSSQVEIDASSTESTMARRMSWDCALHLYEGAPHTGVGTGDIHAQMMNCYAEKGYTGPMKSGLDPHSQYFQTLATLGWWAALLCILAFLLPFISAIRQRHKLAMSFFLILLLAALTEGILERQAGVHFYAILLPVLLQDLFSKDERAL